MTSIEFDQQISGLRSSLLALSRRFTPDREDSRDLVQDTIVKALTYRNKFVQDTNLKGWLFTIMRNTYFNSYRKQRRVKVPEQFNESYFLGVEDHYTFSVPDASYRYKELWAQIDALKDDYSIPLKMHLTGYKYQEIAEHLQIPLGTVKNRIHGGRQEIQKRLAGYSAI